MAGSGGGIGASSDRLGNSRCTNGSRNSQAGTKKGGLQHYRTAGKNTLAFLLQLARSCANTPSLGGDRVRAYRATDENRAPKSQIIVTVEIQFSVRLEGSAS